MGGGGGVQISNGDEDRGRIFLVFAWLLASLAAVTILLRLYSRIFRRPGTAGYDDLCAAVALAFAFGATSAMSLQVHYGFGSHWLSLSSDSYRLSSVKWQYITELLSFFAVSFTRAGVCLFVLRSSPSSPSPSRWTPLIAYMVLAFGVANTLSTVIAASLTCVPLGALWSSSGLKCLNFERMFRGMIATGAIDATVDLATALLPTLLLRHRTFTAWQKVHLTVIFFLAMIPFPSAIARVCLQVGRYDPSYDNLAPAYFGVFEMDIGLIASCLACLAPLFPACWPQSPLHSTCRAGDLCGEVDFPHSPAVSSIVTKSSSVNAGVAGGHVAKPCRCLVSSSSESLVSYRKPGFAHSFASVRAWPARPWLRLTGSKAPQQSEKTRGSLHSQDDAAARVASVSGFPELVPQIGRSSVVKRMDVEVELSKATESEMALTDKVMYASWEDPPDDPDAIEPLGSSNLRSGSHSHRAGSSVRLGLRPAVRSYNTAVAEALAAPQCVHQAKMASERGWWQG